MMKKIAALLIAIIISNTVITSAVAGECVRVARDCIEPAETRVINGHSIHRDCWRYNDAYKCKNYAKNDCYEFDDESYCQLEKSECKEKVGDWCVAQNREYKCEDSISRHSTVDVGKRFLVYEVGSFKKITRMS